MKLRPELVLGFYSHLEFPQGQILNEQEFLDGCSMRIKNSTSKKEQFVFPKDNPI